MLCVIPARGGSKGIPRKNVRDLAGKPLVVWTIESALAVPDLEVVVSTDDAEIAEIARSAGAEVPFVRPPELATDAAATEPVVEHALDDCRVRSGAEPDAVMLLQATSPIRLPGTLARAVERFHDSGADSLVGVVGVSPFLWHRRAGVAAADYDTARRPRRQDLQSGDLRYRETGSLYITRTAIYRSAHNRIGGRVELFVMADVEGVDIDTDDDFTLAAAQLAAMNGTA